MKPLIILFFLLLLQTGAFAQVTISGKVTDEKKLPLAGANVFLQETYDGTTADSLGNFSFNTSRKGAQQLSVTFIGYQPFLRKLDLDSTKTIVLNIVLQESDDQIDEVVINAGAFEAGDEKKAVMLRMFDVAITPSAQGDIFGAFGTLPGVQKVGEDGRFFVRGGEGYETKTFMDGMLVSSSYMSKMPDMPTRGRFSPLLFSGTLFSTGAYSAEYGQALSSIVDMKTNSVETDDQSSISIMTVGVMASTTKCWEKSSLSLSGDYVTGGLSNVINKQQVDWIKSPVGVDGTLMYRRKTSETGMIKFFGTLNNSTSGILYPNTQTGVKQNILLNSHTVYLNNTYNEMLGEKWMIKSGVALNYDHQKIDMDNDQIATNKKMFQAKLGFSHFLNEQTELKFGGDWVNFSYEQKIRIGDNFRLPFTNNQLSGFAEMEYKLSKKFATRFGARVENSSLLKGTTLVPRFSGAYKTGKHSQVSLACGQFYQNPEDDYLKFAPHLNPEKSQHAVMTWQYMTDLKTFRIESYLKKYSNLVKFNQPLATNPLDYNNSGSGHAEGIDLFWRDKETFDLTDYWISYSWINARRNSVSDAAEWLQQNPAPDLAFMDIQLADGLSFEIFERLKVPCPVIFTTAYEEYAIKAFKVNSVDYLLKLIAYNELETAFLKFSNQNSNVQEVPTITIELLNKVKEMIRKQYKTRFVIKVGEHLKSILVENILFFYSLEKATFLCTADFRTYLVDYSLDRISEMVDEQKFFRINRKYILSNQSIADIVVYSNSRLKIKLKKPDEESIIVSRDKVPGFKEWLDF